MHASDSKTATTLGELTRILIADDEPESLAALCETLKTEGYQTAGFASGQAALNALVPGQFDLLLSDLAMPGMDGITLLQAAQQKDPNLVGIIMTGQGTIDSAVQAMRVGALDYIQKPFQRSAILPVLSRALAVRRLRLDNAELAQRIRERTTELEAANKELEAFSFSVSHDLRAPLRAINGFSEILLEKHSAELGPDAQKLLGYVITSTRRMRQLIDGLLQFSRLGRQPLTKRRVNTATLMREVLDDFRSREERPVQIEAGELPDCFGDPLLLKQVFVNLLANAFKFTRHQENPRVEIGSQTNDDEIIYFVRDNGAGFDMRYAQRLFGVFQRLHSEEEFEGTGVGLSIVQRIIQRHGGRIWAEAEETRGATFYFTIPGDAAANTSDVAADVSRR